MIVCRRLSRHTQPRTLIAALLSCIVFAVTFGVRAVLADTVGTQPPPTCSTLLTAAEVKAAVGAAMEDVGANERGGGESDCSWMAGAGRPGFKSVAVQFYDLHFIKGDTATGSPEKFFDQVVVDAENAGSAKRQQLDGVGAEAVFVPTDPQMLIVVRRSDGVARIVGHNLTLAQITDVARAVAAAP